MLCSMTAADIAMTYGGLINQAAAKKDELFENGGLGSCRTIRAKGAKPGLDRMAEMKELSARLAAPQQPTYISSRALGA